MWVKLSLTSPKTEQVPLSAQCISSEIMTEFKKVVFCVGFTHNQKYSMEPFLQRETKVIYVIRDVSEVREYMSAVQYEGLVGIKAVVKGSALCHILLFSTMDSIHHALTHKITLFGAFCKSEKGFFYLLH